MKTELGLIECRSQSIEGIADVSRGRIVSVQKTIGQPASLLAETHNLQHLCGRGQMLRDGGSLARRFGLLKYDHAGRDDHHDQYQQTNEEILPGNSQS